MKIDKQELIDAASRSGISANKAQELWNTLQQKSLTTDYEPHPSSKFELSHLLYYFGAMIVIIALGWLAGIAWDKFQGKGLLTIALAYITIFFVIGNALWRKNENRIPGGLFVTMAVCMIPLAVYGFQRWTGWWLADIPGNYSGFFEWVKGGWFLMELVTIVGGCIALKFYRFPFLTAPIYFALWFMSMDLTAFLYNGSMYEPGFYDIRSWVSMGFGFILLMAAYISDLASRRDFAFWGYLFGMLAFWGGLTMLNSIKGFENFIYLLINIGLVFLSVILQRLVFLIFGSIGVLLYLTSIYAKYFADSVWFPVVLSLTGILIVFAGIAYQKKRQKIDLFILNLLPDNLQQWIPKPKE